jgi:hypothetical protein
LTELHRTAVISDTLEMINAVRRVRMVRTKSTKCKDIQQETAKELVTGMR